MAERFRRVKREENRFLKNILQSRWSRVFLIGLISIVLAYSASFLLYGKNKNVLGKNIKDKWLAAAVCRLESCFWINHNGWAYNHSGRMGGNIVLTVEDKTDRNLAVGEKLLDAQTLAELKFLKEEILEELGLGLKAGETADSNLSDFDFVTSEGWVLRLTVNDNAHKTIETLKQSLAEITQTAASSALEYMDLRIPNKVYYKFR